MFSKFTNNMSRPKKLNNKLRKLLTVKMKRKSLKNPICLINKLNQNSIHINLLT
jgi:hypothetical protein